MLEQGTSSSRFGCASLPTLQAVSAMFSMSEELKERGSEGKKEKIKRQRRKEGGEENTFALQ